MYISLLVLILAVYSECLIVEPRALYSFFFFNDTATTEIYTLSLHDALPISMDAAAQAPRELRDQLFQQVAAKALAAGSIRLAPSPPPPKHFVCRAKNRKPPTATTPNPAFCCKKKKSFEITSSTRTEFQLTVA